MKIKRFRESIAERKDREVACAQAEQNAANIEFIAIMSDIDLNPDEEEDVENA